MCTGNRSPLKTPGDNHEWFFLGGGCIVIISAKITPNIPVSLLHAQGHLHFLAFVLGWNHAVTTDRSEYKHLDLVAYVKSSFSL